MRALADQNADVAIGEALSAQRAKVVPTAIGTELLASCHEPRLPPLMDLQNTAGLRNVPR